MKKTITFILLSVALFAFSGKCHAQFLKKLGKSIEKVSKEVDKALGTEQSASSNNTQDNTAKITVTTPHKNLKVNVLSAVSNGSEFLLEFTITNLGEDIKGYCLMDGNSDKTIAFDNLGNQCSATLLFGNVRSKNNGYAENTLLNGVPIKVVVTITKFGTNATSFSQIKIGAGTDTWKIANHFVFKNVPIIKEQEQEIVIPVKEVNTDSTVNNNILPQATTEKQELQRVNIPKTKFGMKYWNQTERNKYVKGRRITSQERLSLKLNNIKDDVFKEAKNNQLVRGKTVYDGKNGRIESIVFVYDYPSEGQEFLEYIISYDSNGNYVNHLCVGCEKLYYTNDIYTVLEGATIIVTNYYADAGEEETITTKYRISPDLKFNQIK